MLKARLEIAEKELAQAKVEGFHDKLFVNDDLQKTYELLEKYIFGEDDMAVDEANAISEVVNTDAEMMDGNATAGDEAANGGVNGDTNATIDANDTLAVEKSSVMEGDESTK